MWLSTAVVEAVRARAVAVFFVPYAATKVFNTSREPGVPLVFSGWYWALGPREGGPFRSCSAAYRDAWYRLCANTPMPQVHAALAAEERRVRRAARRRTGLAA
jgi:hypothetical protein